MFAIIDVETTGLSAKNEKITEIAILIHDGLKVIESYQTLINPEKNIPYRITQLTGINNQMVHSSPKFYEVAKKIIELTEDKIIVGHNVRFDYSFLQSEFAEFGYAFQRKTLCTVKTSRKLIPGQASYSLGKLTASLGIPHGDQHRAFGDAKATAILMEILYQIDPQIGGVKALQLPKALTNEMIESLPHKTGVYYFLNTHEEIIYVGKSIDIHQRILQHLNNYSTRKSVEMMNNIANINYYVTGGELSALLLESNDIKTLKPLYNRAQRRSLFNYGLFTKIDLEGYYHYSIEKTDAMSAPLTSFQSQDAGKDFLFRLVEEYELCQKFCGLYQSQGACFDYQIHKCHGACIGKESPENYNRRFQLALDSLRFQHQNFYVIEKGPEPGFKSVVQIENGIYQGIGIIEERQMSNKEQLKLCIKPLQNNRDTHQIINSFLRLKSPDLLIY
mgnify:CR=1 FL=1